MLKRLLSLSIALIGTIVALVIYWPVFMPWFHFGLLVPGEPWIKDALALIETALATYLFARWWSWPALLLLIGSIPMLLFNVSYSGWMWRMNRIYGPNPHADSAQLALLFPSDNEQSPIHRTLFYISFLQWCLPVAFFWYFFRVADRHLTKRCSQPLTD